MLQEVRVDRRQVAVERPSSIHDLLQERVRATPEAVAIAAPGRDPLSYRSLLRHVEQTIDTLTQFGLGRNARVAIVLPNGPEMAVSFLAVSACATSVPLNPAYRVREFDALLSRLRASALIVQAGLDSPAISVAKRYGIPVIELTPRSEGEAGAFALEGRPCSPPARSVWATEDDIALV